MAPGHYRAAAARAAAMEPARQPLALGNVLLIVNPISGRGLAGKQVGTVMRHLEAACGRVTCRTTQSRGDAARFVTEAQAADAVFVLGGDGTVNEALHALVQGGPALGILPAGTGNVLAKEHGVPREPERAVRALLHGEKILVDVALARGPSGERRFAEMISAGVDAAAVEWIARHRRGPMRMSHYVLAAAAVLGRKFGPLRVLADGTLLTQDAVYAIATLTHAYGGPLQPVPWADSSDGWLDVLTLDRYSPWQFPLLLASAMAGRLARCRGVQIARARRVVVESATPVPVQCDGDLFGTTPFVADIEPAQLTLIVPSRCPVRSSAK